MNYGIDVIKRSHSLSLICIFINLHIVFAFGLIKTGQCHICNALAIILLNIM